ncbi:ROK family protein [Lactobacillaceae bacterium Melli_B4]
MQIGSIEAGGTKFLCSIGDEHLNIINQIEIPTTTPEETLTKTITYFSQFHDLLAVNIASFGPLCLDPDNDKFGFITNTPKVGWQDTNILGIIKDGLGVDANITTDVNGSVIGESLLLSRQNIKTNSLAYLTIGTGVGAGIMINGQLVGALGHPEFGHIMISKHPDDIDFNGICPFHPSCLEGFAAGPTFKARLGILGCQVPHSHPVWQRIAYYIAQATIELTMTIRPDRIVFGGGVANPDLLAMVKVEFEKINNQYVQIDDLNEYLALTCAANNNAATIGNLSLAKQLICSSS